MQHKTNQMMEKDGIKDGLENIKWKKGSRFFFILVCGVNSRHTSCVIAASALKPHMLIRKKHSGETYFLLSCSSCPLFTLGWISFLNYSSHLDVLLSFWAACLEPCVQLWYAKTVKLMPACMRDARTSGDTEQMDARFGSWKSISYWCCKLLREKREREKIATESIPYSRKSIVPIFYSETQRSTKLKQLEWEGCD